MNITIYPKIQKLLPLLEELGIFFEKVGVNQFTTEHTFVPLIDLTEVIVETEELASLLYALYATGYLTIQDHEYPTYKLWQSSHRRADQKLSEVTLDHILPKSKFPSLTFEVDNWQVMSRDKNKAKGIEYSMSDVNRVLGQY
jgi:hypothetical protein